MPTLHATANRLLMRYHEGNTFMFNRVRVTATDANVFDLSQSFAALQEDAPTQVIRSVTQYLEF